MSYQSSIKKPLLKAASPLTRRPTEEPFSDRLAETDEADYAVQLRQAERFGHTFSAVNLEQAGRPLPGFLRRQLEASFGQDLSDVQIHVDDRAERIGANAVTQGTHIHLPAARYTPASAIGRQLIAHEVAHVVQQRLGKVRRPRAGELPINTEPGLEKEADVLGMKAARGEAAQVDGGRGSGSLSPAGAGPMAIQANGFKDEEEFRHATESHFPESFQKADGSPQSAVSKEEGLAGGWEVYERAKQGHGDAYIERLPDKRRLFPTGTKEEREKRQQLEEEGSLFKPPSRPGRKGGGMWSPQINDAWVLGHIHAGRDTRLLSSPTATNLWDYDANRPTATGRESLQLMSAGYQSLQGRKKQGLRSRVFFRAPRQDKDAPMAGIGDVDRARKFKQLQQVHQLGRQFASQKEQLNSLKKRYRASRTWDETDPSEVAEIMARTIAAQKEQEKQIITD